MKIHIFFQEKQGAWGGGNQFLKALKAYLISINSYEGNHKNADVIIFNSHQLLDEIIRIKYKYPTKIFIHRIDGPMVHYRNGDTYLDLLLFKINDKLSDGTIFQSGYSRDGCYKLGLSGNYFERVITNAPDPEMFNQKNRIQFSRNRRMKLISTSWSSNWKKGFDVYKWLDSNLDFSKYEMTFIGNSPIKFNNIRMVEPLNSLNLSQQLKESDIYIFASKLESCSNSLLEALHCGLPTIAYNSSSMPEIVKNGGELFDNKVDILELLDKVVAHYNSYKQNINLPTMDEVGEDYYNFCKTVYDNKNYTPKRISFFYYCSMLSFLFLKKVKNKLMSYIPYRVAN